jgi:hypothetical protein
MHVGAKPFDIKEAAKGNECCGLMTAVTMRAARDALHKKHKLHLAQQKYGMILIGRITLELDRAFTGAAPASKQLN